MTTSKAMLIRHITLHLCIPPTHPLNVVQQTHHFFKTVAKDPNNASTHNLQVHFSNVLQDRVHQVEKRELVRRLDLEERETRKERSFRLPHF